MQKFYLGKVVKPQGVKGELKIKPNIDENHLIHDQISLPKLQYIVIN